MRFFLTAAAAIFLAAPLAAQDSPIPEKRLVVSTDTDFPGGDVATLLDTTLDGCQNACLARSDCDAFTFNARANACFPKTDTGERSLYEGAISAVVIPNPAALRADGTRRAETLSFLGDHALAQAHDLALGLGRRHTSGGFSAQQYLDAADAARANGNTLDAYRFTGAALTYTDTAYDWIEYGRLALVQSTAKKNTDPVRYRSTALLGAINGYLRTDNAPLQHEALVIMANALEAQGRGRDMIPALRHAQDLQYRDDTEAALDKAIGKYGFRITEHLVENQSALPRLCASFSEPLDPVAHDYAPFVQSGQSGLAVEVEGDKLCLSGVSFGERYRIVLREGLPSKSGEMLAKSVELSLYVRDRDPKVWFPGRNYVLPAGAETALPVTTVNAPTLDLRLLRVSDRNLLRAIQEDLFGRPLSYWASANFERDIAQEVWSGSADVVSELNQDSTTRLPLGEVVGGLTAGIYALEARVPGADPYDDPSAMQWFVVSDIGLATAQGADGLHAFVRALSTAQPAENVTLTLLSRANAELGTAKTDADGYARFEPGLVRGQGGGAPALLLAQWGEDDMSFLPLTDPEFDLSDRGVAGRAPAGAIDLFLATDRGAYRPGETIHLTVLSRDTTAKALTGLPLTAVLSRPDGVEYTRLLSNADLSGGHVLSLPLGRAVPRGTWTLNLYADPEAPALASRRLLVEDFLPERIDFTLTLPDGPIRSTDRPPLAVEARYLFGAPGADLSAEGSLRLVPTRHLESHPGYVFGRHDLRTDPVTVPLPYDIRTNASGTAQIPLEFPTLETNDRPLEAQIALRLSEGSGRPVERRLMRAITPSQPLLGIKPLFDGVLPEASEARFDLIALSPDGTPLSVPVKWTLNRVETHYQWYQLYGEWRWEPITRRSPVSSGKAQLGAQPTSVSANVDWGRYEIVVDATDGSSLSGSEGFSAGWYASADAGQTPDMLEVSLDKDAYLPGETARLRLVPRYDGQALITVMSNRLIDMKSVSVQAGETLVDLPVTEAWGAGAYVTATLVRPMDASAGQNPARALGLSYAPVDPGPSKLTAQFDLPSEARPRAPLDIALKVEGITPGETAHVTIAAVDLGVLNITGFTPPDPAAHYFGQRKLGMGLRDIYGRLINGMDGAMGRVRSGGDGARGLSMEGPPPNDDLVSFFSGPIRVGSDGMAYARMDLPAFNGTIRLMALVWSPTGVGAAHQDVLVRDPVVLSASLPRFLAPGDQAQALLEITHSSGPTGPVALKVESSGLIIDKGSIPAEIDISVGETRRIPLPIIALMAGLQDMTLTLTTPDGQELEQTLRLPVEVNDPPVARTSRFSLAPGQTFTFDREVFAGLAPGTGEATLAIGPLARFDAPGLLNALDRYPYGCTEQITSRALPLLYLGDVATAMGLQSAASLDERISQAISEVLTNQSSNGAFGLWYADSGDLWLDAYVTDFLSRARQKGHDVPDKPFRAALDNLRNQVNYHSDFDQGGEALGYALYVLAREGAAAIGDLRYYSDVKGDAFTTPLGAAQLGGALAAYGDPRRADAMFRRANAMMSRRLSRQEKRVWRSDYGTDLRDMAGLLTLAVEARSQAVDQQSFTETLASPSATLSTQEQVWSLLAAHALIDDSAHSGITINGSTAEGPLVHILADAVGTQAKSIRNTGKTFTDITLTTFGVPLENLPASGDGYAITRRYYTLEGEPVSLENIPQGMRLVTVLTIDPFENGESRLMIDDPLPAGFEIDNPNLLTAGQVSNLNWLDFDIAPQSAQFRADRFLAAVDWSSREPFTLAYIVRAVTPGTFHHPAAAVEDMYRPRFRARTDAGIVTISGG